MTEAPQPAANRGRVAAIAVATRALAVPHGFTLTMTGVVATTIGHRPHAGPVAIWLLVAAAALAYSAAALYSGAAGSPGGPPVVVRGLGLVNLVPITVVPLVDLATWWIRDDDMACLLAGALAMLGYLAGFATVSVIASRVEGFGTRPRGKGALARWIRARRA